MILAPLAIVLLTTAAPDTTALLQKTPSSPATVATTQISLRDAVNDAARRTAPRLEQAPILRGGPRRSSPHVSRKVVAIGLGIVGGFVGGLLIGPAMSHGECMSPLWVVMSTTTAGGAVGWAATRD